MVFARFFDPPINVFEMASKYVKIFDVIIWGLGEALEVPPMIFETKKELLKLTWIFKTTSSFS